MNKPSFSRKRLSALAVLAAGIAIAAWLIFFGGPGMGPGPDEVTELIKLKNRAIGQLENIPNLEVDHQGEEAIAAFEQLARRLPAELIGPRNLAVARLLSLAKLQKAEQPEKYSQLASECRTAIEKLKKREPESGIPYILAAKLAIATGDTGVAIQSYQDACRMMPGDFVPWAELFMLVRDGDSPETRQQALQQASAANRNNLVLLEHLVRAQAEARDQAVLETLDTARRILRPLAENLAQQRIELDQELDDFSRRIKEGDEQAWDDLRIRMIQVFNVVRPEFAYQVDLNQLGRHVLDYVIHDFSGEIYKRLRPGDIYATEGIPVTLSPASHQQLPDLPDAVDIVLMDFTLDDTLEVLILRQVTLEVYSAATGGWELIASCPVPTGMAKLMVVDLDRDTQGTNSAGFEISDEDLLVYGPGGYRLLENKQGKDPQQRQLVVHDSQLPLDPDTPVQQAVAVDLEHDGDLDLVLATAAGISSWTNQESWNFVDSTRQSLPENENRYTSLAAIDWDRNMLVDILVAGRDHPPGRLENLRHGRFRWQDLGKELGVTEGARQLLVCELDGNGSWDLVTCHDGGISVTLTRTVPGESVSAIRNEELPGNPASGVHQWDYDNDGIPDLVAWGSEGLQVFRGVRDGRFAEPFSPAGIPAGTVTGCAVGDMDQDGDQDLALVAAGQAIWCSNDGGNKNHWIDVRICAESDPKMKAQRSNVFGLGSLVELRVGRQYQAQAVSGQITHFGLGDQHQPDVVRVLWTNGIPQSTVRPGSDLAVVQKQRLLTGSCPYLYTWTGEKYEFFTDLLWAAPIGLLSADGTLVPTRDWEYLLIPGERLQAEDGEYRMQVTEELWEAAYFDQVELVAVDHPGEISVFSNEKVGPPSVSEFKVHAIPSSHLFAPRAATNSSGEDILPLVQKRDGHYVKLFDHRLKQGLTNEYFMELDLGSLEDPGDIRLVMTGWVFPTDTSVNVAIVQNPALSPPRPPSISVPDPAEPDGWKQVVPHMGFPGGKTKTIVVTVPADQFVADDYRVRIASSMELYWDSIQVAVDAPAGRFEQTRVDLLAADLHHRGFSLRAIGLHNGPDRYDYQSVTTDPAWPPMAGHFTRFGDVTELLISSDGHLVVLGAGDEMTLRFKELPPPPAGWKRDFLLYNVGWDKDANLNTVLGHHVDPLPYRGMSRYPPGLDDTPPDSPAFADYLRTYQTRRFSMQRFWGPLEENRQVKSPLSGE